MEKAEVDVLKAKLQKIGKDSLVLINKCKYEGVGDNKMHDLAIKINQLAHEIHNSLEKEF